MNRSTMLYIDSSVLVAVENVFSPVTSTNVGISPQNFLAFSFNPLPDRYKISSSYLVSVPNYWTWTKTNPQKKRFFWSNPYKLEVMLRLSFFGDVIDRNYDVITFFSKYRYFTKAWGMCIPFDGSHCVWWKPLFSLISWCL